MNKYRQFIQQLSIQRKLTIVLFLLIVTITGTRAWASTGQGALSMLYVNGKKQDIFSGNRNTESK